MGRYDEGVQSFIDQAPVFAHRAFRLKTDCNGDHMARPGDTIHIPLKTEDAILAFMKVKPTADMPRPGANPMKAKRKRAKSAK
jgi:hypothetical protein